MTQRRRKRILIIGGPDVDKRIDLIQRLRDHFDGFAIGSSADRAARFKKADIPFATYPLQASFHIPSDWKAARALLPLIRHIDPDIVHCFDTKPCIFARLAARVAGVPLIIGTLPGLGALYTYHDSQTVRRRHRYRRLHRQACRVSNHTVFQNQDDRQRYINEDIVSAEASSLIAGSGVCSESFSACSVQQRMRARNRFGLLGNQFCIAFVGRMIYAKGILLLLRALKQVWKHSPHIRLICAGSWQPDHPDALSSQDILDLQQHALWLGEMPRIQNLLAASDLFVFPSFYREGLPRAVIEAAFSRVPVLALDNVGTRDIIEHGKTGLLVGRHSVQALAGAILQALDQPALLAQLSIQAQNDCRQRLSAQVIARQHIDLYYRLMTQQHMECGNNRAIPKFAFQ